MPFLCSNIFRFVRLLYHILLQKITMSKSCIFSVSAAPVMVQLMAAVFTVAKNVKLRTAVQL